MDDEESAAQLAIRKLRASGYEVDWATDGEEGLARVAGQSYDLLAVDFRMPRKDGMDVIRALAGRPHPPIIMITGMGYEAAAVEALRLGVKDYIIKDLEGHYINLLPAVLEQVFAEQALIQAKEEAIQALKRSEDALRKANDELESRVAERTAELKRTNEALMDKIRELEAFSDVVVGRELKMIDMKKEIAALQAEISTLRSAHPSGLRSAR
jgi:DNA-binding response OmpR family regulator